MDALIQEALDRAKGLAPTPANLARVGKDTSPEAAAWAFTQWSLRASARAKFALAESMVFVREALEQATHERIATYHASRFPQGELVADLTCGIGADLVALARRGPAIGFDLDAERADCAVHNLSAHGLSAQVIVGDSLAADWSFDYAFADPARRVASRRTLASSEFSPNPAVLAERMSGLRLGGVKLSPLMLDSNLRALGNEIEFVSFGGECREALVWVGAQSKPGWRAVHVESGENLEMGEVPPDTDEPDAYLFEADPAAIRVHALGTLCARFGLKTLGDSNGYLTGPELLSSPWLKPYRVIHHGKADLKATRQTLEQLGSSTPVLKQRGAGQDLERLRRQFKLAGRRELAVAIWPVGKSLRHTILEPL